jgi:ParB family chromosome partitioning protein
MDKVKKTKPKLKGFAELNNEVDQLIKLSDDNGPKGPEEIELDKLVDFHNHCFELYKGERLDDMIQSIKEMGVITPIIVQPLESDQYEILSGHNRVNASRQAGLVKIPAVIKKDLSEEEATLIVTETNLLQRSFSDLKHSERAKVIKTRYDAMKSQGIRKDLLAELQNDLEASEDKGSETCAQIGHKLKTREMVGSEYSLSKNSIARYLRINELHSYILKWVDNNKIPLNAGVDISYLTEDEQELLIDLQEEKWNKIDLKKSGHLKKFSKSEKLTEENMRMILAGDIEKKKKKKPGKKAKDIKISREIVTKHLGEDIDDSEAVEMIEIALQAYFKKSE